MSNNALMNINGPQPAQDHVAAIAQAIVDIFESARENSIEQSTIVSALDTLSKLGEQQTNITSSNFNGGKTVNVYTDKVDDKDED